MTWSKERIDIKDIKDTTEACNIVATIKQRTPLKKLARNKNSGQMITGILCDTTAAIDFVCWTEAALQFDSILLQQKTFKFENVKVVAAREAYRIPNLYTNFKLPLTKQVCWKKLNARRTNHLHVCKYLQLKIYLQKKIMPKPMF